MTTRDPLTWYDDWDNFFLFLFVLLLFDFLFQFLKESHLFLLLLAFARQLLAPMSPVTPAKRDHR